MQQKTVLLLIILTLVTGVLVYVAVTYEKQAPLTQPTPTPLEQPVATQIPVKKTALLSFDPSTLPTAGRNSTADVILDSGENTVTGVQLEMSFDPAVVSNIKLTAPTGASTFFGNSSNYIVLINNVDFKKGRITYAVGITPNQQPKSGIGSVAKLTFNVSTSAPKQGIIFTLLEESQVAEAGVNDSVLKQVSNLTF